MALMLSPQGQPTYGLDGRELLEPSYNQDDMNRDRAEWQPSQYRVVSFARLRRCACGRAVALRYTVKSRRGHKAVPASVKSRRFLAPRSTRCAKRWTSQPAVR